MSRWSVKDRPKAIAKGMSRKTSNSSSAGEEKSQPISASLRRQPLGFDGAGAALAVVA
jgi:hypothetical protein